ncbi:L-ribulose-5-phosphate 4-epimerase [Enterococcus phoeniculicola]|nr:L-ribulose-5-phosphate 4-epimerase [Enterococcus phoeniculicola]
MIKKGAKIMLMEKERNQIVSYGKKLITSGLTKGTGGNISIYDPDLDLMAISPSGIDYFETQPEDVVVTKLSGEIVDSPRKPSSELDMHRIYYMKRPEIRSVVHTHSPFSTTLATLGWELPAANYYIAIAGGNTIRCAEYASFGTWELAENSFKAMEDRYACFLANHGLLTCSYDLANAFSIAEETERMAEVYWRSKSVGEPKILVDAEVDFMLEKFKTYGQK